MLLLSLACATEIPCGAGYGRVASGGCVALADATDTPSGEPSGDDVVAEPGDDEDSGEPLDLDESLAVELKLSVSEHMPTALVASWSATEGADTWIEVQGYDARYGVGRDQLVLLATEATEVTVQAVAELDGERVESDPLSLVTGSFSDPLPLPAERLDEDASMSEQLLLLSYEGDGVRRVALATGDGELLWQLDDEQLGDAAPVSAQAALDGRGVFVGHWASHAPTLTTERMQDNAIWLYGWDGAPVHELGTPMAHHLFSQPAPGYVAWTGLSLEHREGDTLPTAFERFVISELDGGDHTVYDTSALGSDASCTAGGYYADACDVHHANSLDCDLDGERCLYSLHNIDGVYELSLGGDVVTDFATWPVRSSSGAELKGFDRAHDVHWGQDGSILVFNDGQEGAWAARYAIDRQAGELTELWSYGRDECIASSALGTVQELPSGSHLVGFSTPNNLLREVSSDGRVLWQLDLGGLDDDARCSDGSVSSVLGEARALSVDELGPAVVTLF